MTHAKHLTYGFLGVALGALIMSTVQFSIAAWQGPTATPPNNNVPAPINVGTVAQTKNANLSLGSGASLYAGGLIAAPQLCIGSDCRTAWPVGGSTGGAVTASVVAGCGMHTTEISDGGGMTSPVCWGGATLGFWGSDGCTSSLSKCPADSTKRCLSEGSMICITTSGGSTSGDNLGNHTATMNINMGGSQVTNIGTPVNAGDAATKGYVDGKTGSVLQGAVIAGCSGIPNPTMGSLTSTCWGGAYQSNNSYVCPSGSTQRSTGTTCSTSNSDAGTQTACAPNAICVKN